MVVVVGVVTATLPTHSLEQFMILNQGQEAAFLDIQQWLVGDSPYYFLSGQAGTGKTALARYIKLWAETTLGKWVHVTATTNKAAAVLTASLGAGEEAGTIYSLLGLRVTNDFQTGKQFLQKTNSQTPPEFGALVLVDEASMVDPTLMDFINDGVRDFNLRVLFIGDAYQLPPVNAGSMPVTSEHIPVSYLTEIMRAEKRRDLEEAYTAGRQMVIDDEGIYMPSASENITLVPHEGSKDYLAALLKHDSHAKVLAYTNKAVEGANSICRQLLGLPDDPQPGDILVAEDVVIVNTNRLAYIGQEFEVAEVEDTTFLFNGEQIPAQIITTTDHVRFTRAKDPHVRQACLKHLANVKDWKAYFRFKEIIADLRFTHASTVHKSQGSTYGNVLVMAPNIMTCPGINTRRRLLYVAYTRASQHLHVMTQ